MKSDLQHFPCQLNCMAPYSFAWLMQSCKIRMQKSLHVQHALPLLYNYHRCRRCMGRCTAKQNIKEVREAVLHCNNQQDEHAMCSHHAM